MHVRNIQQLIAGAVALLLGQLANASPGCSVATLDKGASVFAVECSVCHAVKADVPGMMGPNLAGVVGRKPGSLPGFTYSQAMKSKAQAWDRQSIAAFIAQPQAGVPGTYMPYAGLADAADREAIACYLSQQP